MLTFLNALPEPGRLLLLGLALISGALLLRKILIPRPAALDGAGAGTPEVNFLVK